MIRLFLFSIGDWIVVFYHFNPDLEIMPAHRHLNLVLEKITVNNLLIRYFWTTGPFYIQFIKIGPACGTG